MHTQWLFITELYFVYSSPLQAFSHFPVPGVLLLPPPCSVYSGSTTVTSTLRIPTVSSWTPRQCHHLGGGGPFDLPWHQRYTRFRSSYRRNCEPTDSLSRWHWPAWVENTEGFTKAFWDGREEKDFYSHHPASGTDPPSGTNVIFSLHPLPLVPDLL